MTGELCLGSLGVHVIFNDLMQKLKSFICAWWCLFSFKCLPIQPGGCVYMSTSAVTSAGTCYGGMIEELSSGSSSTA